MWNQQIKYHKYILMIAGCAIGLPPMKDNPHLCLPYLCMALASSAPSHGAVLYQSSTDASGILTRATWAGDGTLQTNLPDLVTNPSDSLLVDDFSGTGIYTDIVADGQGRMPNGIGFTSKFVLGGGGTADLKVRPDYTVSGGQLWRGFGVNDFQGVNKITYTITYDTPIAASSVSNFFNFEPMLASLSIIEPGTGLSGTDYEVMATLSGLNSSSDGVNFVPGVDGLNPIAAPTFGATAPGDVVFNSPGDADINTFYMIRGYDANGGGFIDNDDLNKVYATSIEFMVTRDDGMNFPSDAEFRFTPDGAQYDNAPIPEPSSLVLIVLSASGLIFRRNRK